MLASPADARLHDFHPGDALLTARGQHQTGVRRHRRACHRREQLFTRLRFGRVPRQIAPREQRRVRFRRKISRGRACRRRRPDAPVRRSDRKPSAGEQTGEAGRIEQPARGRVDEPHLPKRLRRDAHPRRLVFASVQRRFNAQSRTPLIAGQARVRSARRRQGDRSGSQRPYVRLRRRCPGRAGLPMPWKARHPCVPDRGATRSCAPPAPVARRGRDFGA